MLRIIAIFALLTIVSGAFAFGWVGSDDGSELATFLFWLCAIILAGLAIRGMMRSAPRRG
ncbi:MAG TPA: hypothetical protein VKI45_11050 [Allosphingosinicella sp.]|nr:hypothetical protein [Allosphingosinicella sp.]